MDRGDGSLGSLLSKRDRELEAGARAHFEDPSYYTQTYASRDEDVAYYVALATRTRGPILEQGIGNGRIAIPAARARARSRAPKASLEIWGIDHSAPMLADLRARLGREGELPITLKRADLRRFALKKRFARVFCPFNTALHLYTRHDVERWLACTKKHLLPGGELVFDISMPLMKDLARNPAVPYRMPAFDHPTVGRVQYREHFDYDAARQILFVSMFFEPQDKSGRKKEADFMTPLAHRQFFPQEMEALLHYNGWKVNALYGDFAKGALTSTSDTMVWHARPR